MRVLFLCCFLAIVSPAETLTPVWVQLGPEGAVLARTIVTQPGECPILKADGHALAMKTRQPVPDGFKPACQATVPPGTRSLKWGRRRLRLPKTPDRVMVIGDTGCRIKGAQIQACDDPTLWPFETVSMQIASRKPDLIVHVGDYLYRESVCPDPVKGCAGPHGDNWAAWNVDFFNPARSALAAAPWVFARGNHEACARSFRGWFYYLDPRPFEETCRVYSEPYVVRSGALRIGVLDTGSIVENGKAHPDQITAYARQLRQLSGRADWLADHHPFWDYKVRRNSRVVAAQTTVGPAWDDAQPQGIKLILSGHVHLFEFLALEQDRPNQLIAGDGGTQLDTGIMPDRRGNAARVLAVKAGEVNLSFGFTEVKRERSGWSLTLRDANGEASIECNLPAGSVASCKALRP